MDAMPKIIHNGKNTNSHLHVIKPSRRNAIKMNCSKFAAPISSICRKKIYKLFMFLLVSVKLIIESCLNWPFMPQIPNYYKYTKNGENYHWKKNEHPHMPYWLQLITRNNFKALNRKEITKKIIYTCLKNYSLGNGIHTNKNIIFETYKQKALKAKWYNHRLKLCVGLFIQMTWSK